jgi:hypothetical protein
MAIVGSIKNRSAVEAVVVVKEIAIIASHN